MADEVRTTSSTGGEKGTKLARHDLIPTGPLTALAEHYGKGAEKYADRNWERGYEWSKSYAALQRHAVAFWGGEDIDPETGSPHLAAVVFHAFAMMEWMHTHREFDDRPSGNIGMEATLLSYGNIVVKTDGSIHEDYLINPRYIERDDL